MGLLAIVIVVGGYCSLPSHAEGPSTGTVESHGQSNPATPKANDLSGKTSAEKAGSQITFAGLCHDEQGRAIADVQVSLYLADRAMPFERLQTLRADQAGKFRFQAVAALRGGQTDKSYWLTFAAKGRASVTRRRLSEANNLQIIMPEAASVRSKITGPDGRPVEGAEVWTTSSTSERIDNINAAISNAEGFFEISDLEKRDGKPIPVPGQPGEIAPRPIPFLRVRHPQFAGAAAELPLVPSTINVTLQPAAVIEGRVVYGDSQKPAAGVRLFAGPISENGAMLPSGDAITDSNGRYRFDSLAGGKYNILLSVQKDGYTMAALESFETATGTTKTAPELRLVHGGLIVGRVIDADTGQPICPSVANHPQPDFDIRMYGPSRPWSGGTCEAVSIQEDGSFRLRAAPGKNDVNLRSLTPTVRYRLGVFHLSYKEYWKCVSPGALHLDVGEGETITVEFKVRKNPVTETAPANPQPETHPVTESPGRKGKLPPRPMASDPFGKTSTSKPVREGSPVKDTTANTEESKAEVKSSPIKKLVAGPSSGQERTGPEFGKVGAEPASIQRLEPIAAGDRWGLAVEAYLALAKIDPAKHGLTKDQAILLKESQHQFKESSEQFRQRISDLAKLNVKEIRPFVIQMLRDKDNAGQQAALLILAAWKDKEALPQIRGLMQDRVSFRRQQAVAAYLSIDDGKSAQKEVLDLLKENQGTDNQAVLAGIVTSAMPVDRKVAMLRAARNKLESPRAVPDALRFLLNQGQDLRELLVPLMNNETNLLTLGGYCELATVDKEKRLSAQVRRAMELLSSEPTVAAGGEDVNNEVATAGQAILKAVAVYDLKDVAPRVQELMKSKNATIRTAAQVAGAQLRVPNARKELYAQLSGDASDCQLVATSIMDIPPADEADRAAREKAVLACLGKPSEPYVMRILATCGGEKTVKALEPILDDPDAQRAVYAAWVLAQLPDKSAATKGIRRVAICGLFHHQIYQQGQGIDFPLAPDLNFHQVTGRLNPDPRAYAAGEGPVRIPNNLLVPFPLNDGEPQYAVRCYQLAEADGYRNAPGLDVDFLRSVRTGRQDGMSMDRTHLPLLKEIAAHDSHLEPLMVKGRAVGHFEYRQLAARAIAAITQEKATYRGLAGEAIDSDAFPEPYPDQDRLLAKYFVDRVRNARLSANPQTDRDWQQREAYRMMADYFREKFGSQVLDAIRQEAKQQNVSLHNVLPDKTP